MLRPKNFGFNISTKSTNPLQNDIEFDQKYIAEKAISEFDNLIETLLDHEINVKIFDDDQDLMLPDAVFLNNWLAITPCMRLYLFPMASESRRGERRTEIIDGLVKTIQVNEIIDLSHFESNNLFLESTGSIVFDYDHKIAYASISNRTSEKLFNDFCSEIGFEGFIFNSFDLKGLPIYHTNILLSIANSYSIVCLDCIENSLERAILSKKLAKTGKTIVEISYSQMQSFAGNCLEVFDRNGKSKLIMSRTGYSTLKPGQISTIEQYSEIVIVNVSIIERIGGGSVRCMMMGVPY